MGWIDPINWPWWVEVVLGLLMAWVVWMDIGKGDVGWAVFDGCLVIGSFVAARWKYTRP